MKYVIQVSGTGLYQIYPSQKPTRLGMRVGFQNQFIFDTKSQAIDKANQWLQFSINHCDSNANSQVSSIVIYKSEEQFRRARITELVKEDIIRQFRDWQDFANRVERYRMEYN